MSCTNPLLAYKTPFINPETGKNRIKLLPRRLDYSYADAKLKYGDDLLVLPCGECDACVIARRKLWAMRCYAESLYHLHTCFVTLTYDDFHLPKQLKKSDFQKFIKSIRNSGYLVRYFGCGEYGSKPMTGDVGRPHYHIILFGFFPSDAQPFGKSKSGYLQYTSKFLTDIWSKGFVTFSEFSPEVAGYVAGYVDKKYKQRDCFSLMSKKPGIGERYFYDHFKDFYINDNIVMKNGMLSAVPRYFDKLAEKMNLYIGDIKDKRLLDSDASLYALMRDNSFLHEEQYFVHQSKLFKDKLTKKKRGL